MGFLNYFLSWICAICEIFLCNCFVDEYTDGSFIDSKKNRVILSILIIGTILAINRALGILVSWVMILIESFVLFLVIKNHRNRLLKFSIVLLYNTYIGLLQLSIAACILAFTENSVENIYYNFNLYRNICYWIPLGIMFAIYRWGSSHEKKESFFEAYKWTFLFYGVAGLVFIITFQNRLLIFGKYISAETLLFLLCSIGASGLVIIGSLKNAATKARIEILEYRDAMMEENYREIESIYNNCAYTQHDFKNHLIVLSNYCEKGEMEKALQYVNRILEPLEKVQQYINFKDDILSIVLNYKLEVARSKGIIVEADISDIGDIVIEEHDLCSIISNLLDNAVEACEDLLHVEKVIQVTINNMNDVLIIKVSNTYSSQNKAKKKQQGEFALRGFGQRAVADKVKKYGGTVEFSNDEKYYHAIVTIYCN